MLPRLLALPLFLLLVLSGCSSFRADPLRIDLAGLEPLPSQGLEMRFALSLRVQNPNNRAIDYNGIALDLAVNGQPLASGVSNQTGQIPGFGEAIIQVPVTISALSAIRQAWGAAGYRPGQGLAYRLDGKFAGSFFASQRFSDSGTLTWPAALAP